jgi:hypothetical protein
LLIGIRASRRFIAALSFSETAVRRLEGGHDGKERQTDMHRRRSRDAWIRPGARDGGGRHLHHVLLLLRDRAV